MSLPRRRRGSARVLVLMLAGFWSGSLASAAEPPTTYPTIQHAFLREDFASVAVMAQAFLAQNSDAPEGPRVRLWLALSLDRLQRSTDALHELDLLKGQLATRDLLWPEVLFWEGEICRRATQMLRAKLAYQQLLERYPNSTWSAQAQMGLGSIYVEQQAFESAIGHLHEVALRREGTPIALDAHLLEGLCHLRLKRFNDAVAIFQPLLQQLNEPSVIAQTSLYLGESLSGLGRYDEAAQAYQRAIGASATSKWSQLARFGLGWAYYQIGRCGESVDAFEWYLAQPGSSEHQTDALFAEGSCLMQLGREQGALSRFEEVMADDPDNPLAMESGLAIAQIYRRQERFDLAKGLLHNLLRRKLTDTARERIQLQLGALALEQGNAAQAKTVYGLAVESGELAIRQAALSGLGDVQMFLGDLLEAKRFYEKAVQLDEHTPVGRSASYQVGRIRLLSGEIDEAVRTFQRLSVSSDLGLADDARLALALALLNHGQASQARTRLETVRQQRPNSLAAARAAYYLGLITLETGDELAARAFCEEAIAKAPGTEEAIDARLLLADIRASHTSVDEATEWLKDVYVSPGLSRRHRARIAKRIGDLARNNREYDEAIQWYEEAAALLPSLNGEAAYRIASCHEEAGRLEEAMQGYQQITQAPWRVRGQLALAKLLERGDRIADAEAIYEALAHEPIPEAKVVQERLSTLRTAGRQKE